MLGLGHIAKFFSRREELYSVDEKNSKTEVKHANEIMSLGDFSDFSKGILKRWRLLFSCGPRELMMKENRIPLCMLLFLGVLLYPIIIRIFFGLFGFITSYYIYYKYGAIRSGDPAWGMIQGGGFHLHHWMYCSIILVTIWVLGVDHPGLVGLCFGGIVHGIQFNDCFEFGVGKKKNT